MSSTISSNSNNNNNNNNNKRKRKLQQEQQQQRLSQQENNNNHDGNAQQDQEHTDMTNTNNATTSSSSQQQQQQQQQGQDTKGWRVKLYRLNADGSWDDCGTGRIVCLYKTSNNSSTSAGNNTNNLLTPQERVYQELGEPTLCMHAEQGSSSNGNSAATTAKVLLRTRVLLRDAYQRQGDNIITWCEPYFEENTTNTQTQTNTGEGGGGGETSASNTAGASTGGQVSTTAIQQQQPQGVDLALSFQDNAGCLDIWRQITQVQSRAAELFRRFRGGGAGSVILKQGQPPSQQSQPHDVQQQGQQQQQQPGQTEQQQDHPSMADMAQAVAAAHHASLQRQQQHALWVNVASEATGQGQQQQQQQHFQQQAAGGMDDDHDMVVDNAGVDGGGALFDPQQQQHHHHHHHHHQDPEAVAVGMAAAAAAAAYGGPELPHPPTLQNLDEIADLIAAAASAQPQQPQQQQQQHPQQQQQHQRETLALWLSRSDCAYLRSLLQLFDPAEARHDYGALATLAGCIKTILNLNDPTIIDWIVNDEQMYEHVCATLEYGPDLREKANHRWFLRERAKFRTVVLMEDEELIETIHRSFRVTFLRDNLLRPTMDEASLSTLSSLQTFTHADVVKGVTCPLKNIKHNGDSYLILVMRLLGREVRAISEMEWEEMREAPETLQYSGNNKSPRTASPSSTVTTTAPSGWKQHLAPQDGSLASRKIRRRGCLSFFRELFNMVRISLQPSDKDDFYAGIVGMEIDLKEEEEQQQQQQQEQQPMRQVKPNEEVCSVNLLSLLGAILADPTADVTEKSSILEIIGAIAMHDPGLIRRFCLDYFQIWKEDVGRKSDMAGPARPNPNERRQVVFRCPPNDLLASLLFLLSLETDAGLLLQTTEIMRIILDTDMIGEHGPLNAGLGGGLEDDNGSLLGMPGGLGGDQVGGKAPTQQELAQNQFLTLFYEHYVQWLVAPFQFTIVHPGRRFPDSIMINRNNEQQKSRTFLRVRELFKGGVSKEDALLRIIPHNAIRASFALELVSFCVRAHLYRMKFFLLRSKVLGNVMKQLNPSMGPLSGDRCQKLAALRLLRSILSVKDEFYHRHIISNNLFTPVFVAFRANPVGDNLVSSAIVEMCDFIQNQNIKSLIEHIVLKHLSENDSSKGKTLEEVASPYVSTLATLRKTYEENLQSSKRADADGRHVDQTRYFGSSLVRKTNLSEKAIEDQRKFREADAEESYFDAEDDDDTAQKDYAGSNSGGDDGASASIVERMPSPTPMGSQFPAGSAPLLKPKLATGSSALPEDGKDLTEGQSKV